MKRTEGKKFKKAFKNGKWDNKVYSEYDEQFQVFAWIALVLLIVEYLILDRKNRIFRKIKLFS